MAMQEPVLIDEPAISDLLVSPSSPLDILIEKEENQIKAKKYQSLSSEAKQVIDIVLNTPTELLELITSSTLHKIGKNRIRLMMQRHWKDKKYADKVISELESFVSVNEERVERKLPVKKQVNGQKIHRGRFVIVSGIDDHNELETLSELRKELLL
jgi:mRNA-degrading endonuclease RelE of RelBE toxin-antitoxin system